LYISYNFEVLHKLLAEVADHLQTLYINFYVEPNTLSATPVAQQFQKNTSTATSDLFFNPVISCIITPLNWKQAAIPLHIEQHRHSLSITKSYGEKGILFSMIKLKMQKKSCKTNDRHFSKFHWQMKF
jgi:hypothetical protein